MNNIDLKQLDLNLLVVLDVLLEEQHVTRTARRLGRTQSAVSHALSRLREQLADPLLVRVGGRMEPTPRAQALGGDARWDPASSTRTFTLYAPDFVGAAALPELLATTAHTAPGVRVELLPARASMFRDVAQGHTDLALAPRRARRDTSADGLETARVAELEWSVFARADHPAVADWSLERWLDFPHLRVRTSRPHNPIDDALAQQGLERTRGPSIPHFLLAPTLLAATDLLFTVPRGVLANVAKNFGLVALPCPVELEPIALTLYWSAGRSRDPATCWFRDLVLEAARRALTE